MTERAINKQKSFFTSKLEVNLEKKLLSCYIWSIASCCSVIGAFWKVGDGPGCSVDRATVYVLGGSNPSGVRFSAHVQTGSGAHPASCTMGTGSFSGVESDRGATQTPHLLLVTWSKSRVEPYLSSP
jgi:hypothetical protein